METLNISVAKIIFTMRISILFSLLITISSIAAQSKQYIVGQWQATSSEFGVHYIIDWTIRSDQQSIVRVTVNNRYGEEQRTWNYTAPYITLSNSCKTTFKGEIEWKDKNQFTLTIIDDGNPDNKGVKRYYYRQKEQVLAKENGTMPTRVSPSGSTCYACYGTGKADCSLCGGASGYYDRIPYQRYNPTTGYYDTEYRDEWRTCTAMGCNGGKVKCTSCNHRDVSQSATYSPVPAPEGLFGRWKSGASIYHFQVDTGSEGRYLTIEEGGGKYYGFWAIEDGYLKIRLFLGGNSEWEKYRFTSFDRNNLTLTHSNNFSTLKLQRLKE
jgi:hypothetical protein